MEKKLVKPGRLNMHADKILLNTRGEVKLSCPVQERWLAEPMNSNAFLGIPLNFSMAPERCKGTRGAHIRVYKQSLHTLLQKLSLYAMRCNAHQRKFLLWQAYIHCQFVMTHPTHNKNHQNKRWSSWCACRSLPTRLCSVPCCHWDLASAPGRRQSSIHQSSRARGETERC